MKKFKTQIRWYLLYDEGENHPCQHRVEMYLLQSYLCLFLLIRVLNISVHARITEPRRLQNLYPKILQIPINKMRNVELDWLSRETGSFLSREDHFSVHTKLLL